MSSKRRRRLPGRRPRLGETPAKQRTRHPERTWRAQPTPVARHFVRVHDDGIGVRDRGERRTEAVRCGGDQAVCAVDMEPRPEFPCDLGQVVEGYCSGVRGARDPHHRDRDHVIALVLSSAAAAPRRRSGRRHRREHAGSRPGRTQALRSSVESCGEPARRRKPWRALHRVTRPRIRPRRVARTPTAGQHRAPPGSRWSRRWTAPLMCSGNAAELSDPVQCHPLQVVEGVHHVALPPTAAEASQAATADVVGPVVMKPLQPGSLICASRSE